jgi:hypothetical protein
VQITQWKTKVLFTVSYIGLVAVLYLLRVSCVFQTLFGIACPGCGMTRAMIAALQLHFKEAFGYHPMFWSVPILYLYFLLDEGIFRRKLWDRVILWGIGAGFLLNWLLKL